MSASRRKQGDVAARRLEILRMKAEGMSSPEIGAELGMSAAAVRTDLSRALEDSAASHARSPALAAALELERLDVAEQTANAVRLIAAGQPGIDSRLLALAAVDRMLKIHDRRARLLALAGAARVRPPQDREKPQADEIAARRVKRRNRFRAATG